MCAPVWECLQHWMARHQYTHPGAAVVCSKILLSVWPYECVHSSEASRLAGGCLTPSPSRLNHQQQCGQQRGVPIHMKYRRNGRMQDIKIKLCATSPTDHDRVDCLSHLSVSVHTGLPPRPDHPCTVRTRLTPHHALPTPHSTTPTMLHRLPPAVRNAGSPPTCKSPPRVAKTPTFSWGDALLTTLAPAAARQAHPVSACPVAHP
jgi:hypothetical protein